MKTWLVYRRKLTTTTIVPRPELGDRPCVRGGPGPVSRHLPPPGPAPGRPGQGAEDHQPDRHGLQAALFHPRIVHLPLSRALVRRPRKEATAGHASARSHSHGHLANGQSDLNYFQLFLII